MEKVLELMLLKVWKIKCKEIIDLDEKIGLNL